jgi:hypothetical protein
LIDVAKQKGIDYQLAAIGRATPTDANSLQVTRSGVATALVSVPNRYMHSAVETISLAVGIIDNPSIQIERAHPHMYPLYTNLWLSVYTCRMPLP